MKTEKEKRDAGELYYAGAESEGAESEFLDEVRRAKDLCYRYNQFPKAQRTGTHMLAWSEFIEP